MTNYVTKHEHDDQVVVMLPIESDEVLDIGEKMEAINDMAYMNGYNWEAFMNAYLEINHPDLLEGLGTDPEAGCYLGIYEISDSAKAEQLQSIMNGLLNNPEKLYSFLRENGEDIEWD